MMNQHPQFLPSPLWVRPLNSPLLLTRWGAFQVQFFFCFGNESIWSIKKNGTMEVSQNRMFYFEVIEFLPFGPPSIDERRTTFVYGIKVSWYGEHVGEHIGNLGNILEPDREPGKNEKKPLPLLNLKRGEKARHLECMLGPSHWLHEISFPKRVGQHFGPGLLALAKNTLSIKPKKCNLNLNS